MFIGPLSHRMANPFSGRTLQKSWQRPRAFCQRHAPPIKDRYTVSQLPASSGLFKRLMSYLTADTHKSSPSVQLEQRLSTGNAMHVPVSPLSSGKTEFEVIYSEKDLYSLGGYSAVLDRLGDLVRYLQDPGKYLAAGARAPKGIILSGPPGVGKTHLAEAVAGHAGVPCLMVGTGEVQQSSVGGAEEYLRRLFKKAEAIAPCVICLDEIESIATKRVTELSDKNQIHMHYINATINQLLTLLSKDLPGVIVIGTTNHYELLDSAIVRPGRFDRHIALSLPNATDRKQILDIHTENKQLDKNVDVEDLIALTAGFSGAKIAALVNEASIAAMREKSACINHVHFDTALTLLEEGIVFKSVADLPHKSLVAAHEAGHAVVGHLMGKRIYKVSILQSHKAHGGTFWIAPEQTLNLMQQELLDEICLALAGRAAETIMGNLQMGNKQDIDRAKYIARLMVNEEGMGKTFQGSALEIEHILQTQLAQAMALLQKNRSLWERLRDALLQHDMIFRTDFLKIVEGKTLETRSGRPSWEKLLPLPPSEKHIFQYTVTKKDIAKAFQIDDRDIDQILDFSGQIKISFCFYVDDNDVKDLSKKLTEMNIKNFYNELTYELVIHSSSKFQFIRLCYN